eukprot:5949301-Amphidinium_carterae.1
MPYASDCGMCEKSDRVVAEELVGLGLLPALQGCLRCGGRLLKDARKDALHLSTWRCKGCRTRA